MINSRDLFEQIGFVVDTPSRQSPYKSKGKIQYQQKPFESNRKKKYKTIEQQFKKPDYITSLQIQLGENQNHILKIKSYDDPYQLAINFCKKHNLNQLAVQIVQNKIIEAMQREQLKIIQKCQENQQFNSTSYKKLNPKQIIPQNNCNQQFLKNTPYQQKQQITQLQKNKPQNISRTITPSKQYKRKQQISKSKGKQITQRTEKYKQSKKQNNLSQKKSNAIVDKACENLYFRGVLQTKALQEKRIKRQQQLQQKQQQELTFKPKINQVSQKIIQFRKETGTVPLRNHNKVKKQLTDQYYKELQQCTFTPQINPISKIIIHNREAYKNEDDHFNQLFANSQAQSVTDNVLKQKNYFNQNFQSKTLCNKKSKAYLLKQKQKEQKTLFKPKLNVKSIEQIKQPFNVRLSRAIQMKQKIKEGEYMNDQYTFQPQVGRSPFYQPLRGQNTQNNKQNLPVWEQLYKESQIRAKKRQKTKESKSRQNLTSATTSQCQFDSLTNDVSRNSLGMISKATSSLHYQNLVQKRINNVFQLLDSDEDGIISPNTIGIQNLSKNVLIFLKPIFEQMDQLDAELNYDEFKKAVINLLNDSDPHKKGLFLSQYTKKSTNQHSFAPQINSKSKALAEGRNNSQIHLQLYEQGIKNQKRKQFMLQKQRAKNEQKLLEECSFKPCLHLGRKDYHPSILDKKLSQIQFSVNQSSNSGQYISSHQDDQQYY